MKRLLVVVVLFVLAVPCLAFGQATQQKAPPAKGKSVEPEVMALEREWLETLRTHDVAWFERHLASTFMQTDQDGVFLTKAAYVADIKAGVFKIETASYEDLKVQVYGDAAVVTGITAVKAIYKGKKEVSGKMRWTDTWVKLGGQWQCVAGHVSKIAEQ